MATMEPWVSEDILDLEGLKKEDIWDMIMQEFPRMEQSPIFEAGYENWDPHDVKNLETHKGWVPKIKWGLNRAYPGKTLDASAIDYLNTINIEPHVPRENLGSVVGHELPHLGMRLDSEWNQLFPPWAWKGIEGRIEKEEKLNMMHDVMYAPKGYYGQANRGELMNMGYIEPWHSGHQYSDKGNELIRTSGLPQEFQRGLGYYESPNKSQLDQERESTINWLNSRIDGSPQRSSNRPNPHRDISGPVTTSPQRAQVGPPGYNYNTGGLASLRGR